MRSLIINLVLFMLPIPTPDETGIVIETIIDYYIK